MTLSNSSFSWPMYTLGILTLFWTTASAGKILLRLRDFQKIEMVCKTCDAPEADATFWVREGGEALSSRASGYGQRILFEEASYDDEGTYWCHQQQPATRIPKAVFVSVSKSMRKIAFDPQVLA